MSAHYQIILCTCPDFDTANKIAQYLVKAKRAACVNILPIAASVYEWQGKIESTAEHLMLIKSCDTQYSLIEAEIKRLHPYELPEIIAVAIEQGLPDYLKWINSCLLPE